MAKKSKSGLDDEPDEQPPPAVPEAARGPAPGSAPPQPPEPSQASPDGPTAAEEQRARSAAYEAGHLPPDERPEAERANRPVPGVVNRPVIDDNADKGDFNR